MSLARHDLIPEGALNKGDTDELAHEVLANHLADLAANGPTPANIALFGAWGSGKSSFYELLRRSRHIGKSVKLVRYDAWKYGGAALQRNFLSHLADQLDFDDDKFSRGLYSARKWVDFDRSAFFGRAFWQFALWLLAALVMAVLFATGAWSVFTSLGWVDEADSLAELGRSFATFGAAAGALILGAGAARTIWSLVEIEIQESRPSSEEQFTQLFRELVDRVKNGGCSRLVVFIDELDRCRPTEVTDTLTSLKTFLDEKHCVFVVAADRDVLEKAVADSPHQPAPVHDDPYYSSASSFIDKIFQYQFNLPPLRASRMEAFAHKLVDGRNGLWLDLRKTGNHDNDLETVLYLLTPSHVRSPRRLKVLLNNFAVNARTADARKIDWLSRAAEIAKFTVLQTEFPEVMRKARDAPHLMRALVDPDFLDNASDRVREQVHTILAPETPPNETEADGDGDGAGAADADTGTRSTMMSAQVTDRLLRYLQRARRHADPGGDLFYLESIGAAHGIEDSALAEVIERAADDPETAAEEILEREPEERLAAVRALSGRVDSMRVGRERDNFLYTLLSLAAELGAEFGPSARNAINAVGSFVAHRPLEEEFLVHALELACLDGSGAALRATLLKDPRYLETNERLAATCRLAGHFGPEERQKVFQAVSEALEDGPDVLVEGIDGLPDKVAARLLEAARGPLCRALRGELWDTIEDPLGLLTASLDEHGGEAVANKLHFILMQSNAESAYKEGLARAPDRLPHLNKAQRVQRGRLGIARGSVDDWGVWAEWIEDAPRGRDGAVPCMLNVIGSLWVLEDENADAAEKVVRESAKALISLDDDELAQLSEALAEALAHTAWWTSEDAANDQVRVVELMIVAAEAQPELRDLASDALERWIDDALNDPAERTVHGYDVIRRTAKHVEAEHRRNALESISEHPSDGFTPDRIRAREHARLELGASLGVTGEELARHAALSVNVGDNGETEPDERSIAALGSWFDTTPAPEDVIDLIRTELDHAGPSTARAFDGWFQSQNDATRTQALLALVESDGSLEPWAELLAPMGVDDNRVTKAFLDELDAATHRNVRDTWMRRLVAIRPGTTAAQKRLGTAIAGLLNSDTKADNDIAMRGVTALVRGEFGTARAISRALETAAAQGWTLGKRQVRDCEDAGISPPKAALPDEMGVD